MKNQSINSNLTEEQLDNWSLLVYNEMDKCAEQLRYYDVEHPRFRYARGVQDGLSMALSLLSMVEKGRFKARIVRLKEAEEKAVKNKEAV